MLCIYTIWATLVYLGPVGSSKLPINMLPMPAPKTFYRIQLRLELRTGTAKLRETQEYPAAFAKAIACLHLEDKAEAGALEYGTT